MIYSVKPKLMLDSEYITMLIMMVGTTIAPWMQFYQQSAVVEKGITAKEYRESRIEVIVGCILTSVIAFFIIFACAGAFRDHPTNIDSAKEAALALKPFGQYAFAALQRGPPQRLGFRSVPSCPSRPPIPSARGWVSSPE